ncbi:hypothetical protein [Nocardia sp. AG03]|uniref:hypothetical protein n=1 Tax=Nocardia sp. AG03 TaxID=3025312 RepID=UPI002418A74A|nr:hypothetical protein [Nocardia sp. AG03]
MKKIRTVGLGIVLATGLAMFGTGIANAAPQAPAPSAYSITDPKPGEPAEEEATTGSADGLAALLEALVTGSAGGDDATDPTDPPVETTAGAITDPKPEEPVEEPSTGSADGLAALLEALATGSAGGDDATDPTDPPVETTAGAITDPKPGEPAEEEATTGSADGLAALLEGLLTGSAGEEDPATETD